MIRNCIRLTTLFLFLLMSFESSAAALRLCTAMPQSYLEKNNSFFTGGTVQEIDCIFNQLNLEYQIELSPRQSCEKMVSSGRVDGALSIISEAPIN